MRDNLREISTTQPLNECVMTDEELLNAAQELSKSLANRFSQSTHAVSSTKIPSSTEKNTSQSQGEDPLIGLFSGSPDLATQAEEILEQELNSISGFTWKES